MGVLGSLAAPTPIHSQADVQQPENSVEAALAEFAARHGSEQVLGSLLRSDLSIGGLPAQVWERQVLVLLADGSVAPFDILSELGIELPSSWPLPDDDLVAALPDPSAFDYLDQAAALLRAMELEHEDAAAMGLTTAVQLAESCETIALVECDDNLLLALGLELWGLPVSLPQYDPERDTVAVRFQWGVLTHARADGTNWWEPLGALAMPVLLALAEDPEGAPAVSVATVADTGRDTPGEIRTPDGEPATNESPVPAPALSAAAPSGPIVLPTLTPEPAATPRPTFTQTPEPTSTRTPQPTATPRPSSTPTPRPSATSTAAPTWTPTATPTPHTPQLTGFDPPSFSPSRGGGTNCGQQLNALGRYFGSQPGTVLFDGRSASVTSWADGRVQFKVPTSVTGYGPFDVQVSVDSRTSNTLSYTLANPCS